MAFYSMTCGHLLICAVFFYNNSTFYEGLMDWHKFIGRRETCLEMFVEHRITVAGIFKLTIRSS
jgi:hypothetical protein